MRLKYLLTLITLSFQMSVYAQMGKYFSTEDQLSSSFVTQVYLDREGYIWTTTRNGINRYDGYQFRVFKKENEQDKTLASNYVNTMMQDRNGLFYFGMYGALQTWDGEKFHNVKMLDHQGNENYGYATCFIERKNGDVLAGTSGLGVMKFTDQNTARQLGGPFADIHTVDALIEDRNGRLWMLATSKGLLCFDGNQMKQYLADRSDLTMVSVCEDQEGNVYVGTNAGLYRQQGEQFVHVAATGNASISALQCDHYGRILVGYDGKGIAIYDPRKDEVEDNPFFSMEVNLAQSKVYSIIEDYSGNIWLGLLQKGIYKQPIDFNGFQYMGYKLGARNAIGTACVVSVLIDSKQRTWVGTDKDGIYIFDANDKLIRHIKEGYPSTVMTIAEDSNGHIWIGSYGEGGGWIDPRTMQYHKLNYPQDEHLIIMDIVQDKQDRLWAATMRHGVLCFTLQGELVAGYEQISGADKDRKVNSITNNYISQVSVSPDGKRLYAATSMGICCLDITSGSWTKTFGTNCPNYSIPVRIAKEYNGHLWYGTNEGLYCYDLASKKTVHYTTADGLSDNGVSIIECDQQGTLWIGTDHGLTSFNPATGKWQNYFADNGLQSNEFGDGASCLTPKGTIIMGGTGGVTWFKPQDIVQNKWEANVQLTSFSINGKPVNTASMSDGYRVTETNVIRSNRFELSYQDNSFAIQFSTLTYENPEHISYLYSINGEPFTRLKAGMNELTFSHLPQGTYRFRVKAERNGQETPVREFTVVVHSPWYRSAWAYFFYALIAGMFLWQYFSYRRHKEQARLRLQEHLHAEELGEAKLRFFINMSHEIRTPMTLIVTPLLSLIKNEKDPSRKSMYETIKRNAERILSLINQMMDLRKIDKGQMQMRMSETDLVGFIQDIYTLFASQAKTKHINLLYEHDTDSLPIWIDKANFDKVVMNILSNAFKFTPAGGEIGIRLTHDDQYATIAIRDNGEQIPADKLDRIFERFYQTPTSVNDRHAGTGVGLDLTRSLVELHHGTITAHNLEQGCEFTVTIPLGNAHLRPEEMISEKETATLGMMESEEEDMQSEVIPEIHGQHNGRARIVIAEDDEEIRNFLESELGSDYEMHACVNGREALGEVLRTVPDLVISDVMMPEMDGNTLCSKLKTNPNTNYIPVILLTAKSRDEDKLEGLETGADAYIVKPFNMDILRRTIINLINTHRLLRLKFERNDELEEQVNEIRLKSPDEKLLERIMDCINKNLNNSDLSVDMIADEAGISRVHLHRKMKELTGQTPHDFIRNIRLKKAAQLLANQGMNVTEVMYACGFANSASFSTVFKRFYGMSPRDYMREHEER